nr:hypothetical protein [Tanacetum cinerariifolium]
NPLYLTRSKQAQPALYNGHEILKDNHAPAKVHNALYNDLNKVAIGYRNPLCLTRAKQAQPALYNGHEILKDNHAPAKVHNAEDTLEIAEITRKKINAKMTDPECVTHKAKIAPHDYTKENFLATFAHQKQLTLEQIYWSNDLMKLKSEALKERAKRITPTGLTDGRRGFEQTKACYLQEVIPFFKPIKDNFEGIQKALTKKVKEMKDVFKELEAEVAQSRFAEMHVANTSVEVRCLALEAELATLRDKNHQENQGELIKHFSKLETTDSQITKLTDHVTHLQAQNDMNNRDAHLDYLRHLKESVETIRDIVEEAKVSMRLALVLKALNNELNNLPTFLSLGRRVNSCPNASGSHPKSHFKANRISPAKGDNKLPVDNQSRKNKSHLRTSNRIDSSSRLKRIVINSHSDSICQTCNKYLTPFNHDLCMATCLQSAMATPSIHYNSSVERKVKQVWKPKQVRQVWKPTGQVLTTIGHK